MRLEATIAPGISQLGRDSNYCRTVPENGTDNISVRQRGEISIGFINISHNGVVMQPIKLQTLFLSLPLTARNCLINQPEAILFLLSKLRIRDNDNLSNGGFMLCCLYARLLPILPLLVARVTFPGNIGRYREPNR